jgi:hypothetical protein
MSLELPTKTDLNGTPTVTEYKDAIGQLYDFISSGFFDPVAGAGTANAQTAAIGETGGYKTNRQYCYRATVANTGAMTVNFDSLGAKNVKLLDGTDPYSGAVPIGHIPVFRYDGTNLVLLNPAAVKKTVAGSFTSSSLAVNATYNETITHGLGTDNVLVSLFAEASIVFGQWEACWRRPDAKHAVVHGDGITSITAIGSSTPSSGDISIRVKNRHASSAQTITVNYEITALD